jgi:hypothetical protein
MSSVSYGLNVGNDEQPDTVTVGTAQGAALTTAQTDVGTTDTAIDAAVTAAGTADTATGTAQTDVGTTDTAIDAVVSDNTTTLSDIDSFAAAVIAITGDTYVAHQFVFGGGTGLTHAQVATTFALLNTAITAFLAGQTAALTAQTDSDAAVAAVGTAKTDTAAALVAATTAQTDSDAAVAAVNLLSVQANDIEVRIDLTKIKTRNDVLLTMEAIERYIENQGSVDLGVV